MFAGITFVNFANAASGLTGEELNSQFDSLVVPFLKAYCLDCHGTELQEAKLDLSGYASSKDVAEAHQVWEIVLDRLVAKEMPPEDSKRQPTAIQRSTVIDWIRAAREFEATRNAGDPGPVLARRLSNAEYNYSIRDLTGVDIRPTQTFPVDPANESGFDNSGESLTMSPALVKKYLDATRLVVEHLVLTPTGLAFAPHPVVTDTDRDKYCVKRIVQFYKEQPTDVADYILAAWQYRHRVALGNPTASLTDVAVQHGVSAKYLATVWSLLVDEKDAVGPIRTLQTMWNELPDDVEQLELATAACRRMSDFIAQVRRKLVPTFDDLFIEGNHKGSQPFVLWKNRQYATHRRSLNRAVLRVQDASPAEKSPVDTPPDVTATVDTDLIVPADENLRARHEAAFERFCSVFPDAFYISERSRDYVKESQKQDGEKGRLLSAGFHSMMGYFRDDRPLYDMVLNAAGQQQLDALWQELDFVASAPMRQYVGFLWFERTDSRYMRDPQFDFARAEDRHALSEEMIEKLSELYLKKARDSGGTDVAVQAIEHYFKEINDQIRWVEATRLAAESSHLNAVLDFASRAYRRSLSAAERDGLMTFYRRLRTDDGHSHEEAIQDTIVSLLMSPYFSYRLDAAGSGEGRRPLTDDELASRLSYFLWSSLPDETLLQQAAAGRLHHSETLIAQTRRMLSDERVRGLATEFGGNWLDFRRFEEHNSVARERFPNFTDELRQAMFEEPIRFLMDVVQQNRSVLDFLGADHTFVNAELARHYGMPTTGVSDDEWVRVSNALNYNRGGLLPMSVFLTKNAPGLRTSPVKRGYWVVRRLLGERIPPPPPNVPDLPDDETKLGDLTLRETLARHREHVSCAGCHARIDSIGLAFEGFGPVGERRDKDLGGRPVNTTATFPGGDEGTGIDDLRSYIRNHRQNEYLENLCRKLLSFALGRSLILSDDLLIREMRVKLAADGFRFGSLIESIVTSSQFIHKRGASHLASE